MWKVSHTHTKACVYLFVRLFAFNLLLVDELIFFVCCVTVNSIGTDLTDTLNSMKFVLEQPGYGTKVIFGLDLNGEGKDSTRTFGYYFDLMTMWRSDKHIFGICFVVVVIGEKSGKIIGDIGAQCIGDGLKSLTSLTTLNLRCE